MSGKDPQIFQAGLPFRPRRASVLTRTARICLLFIAVALSVIFFRGKRLVDGYTICSRDGDNVYTVDGVNSRAQCLVVSNSLVVATGDLGQCFHFLCNIGLHCRVLTTKALFKPNGLHCQSSTRPKDPLLFLG